MPGGPPGVPGVGPVIFFPAATPGNVTFNDVRQAIIAGLTSAQAEALGWNAQVRNTLPVSAVVRTSDTVVTITLPAEAAYDITANETITVTVPQMATVGDGQLTPTTFSISAAASQTVIPTGQVATGQFGSLTIVGDVTVIPTGQVATGSFGTPIIVIVVIPTGQVATGSFGTLSFVISPTITPTGQVATGSFGTVTVVTGITIIPTGQVATGSFGTPVVKIDVTVIPGGRVATGSFGSPFYDTGFPDVLQRIGATTRVKAPSFQGPGISITVAVTGRAATGSRGSITAVVSDGDVLLRVGASSRVLAPAFALPALTQDVLMSVGAGTRIITSVFEDQPFNAQPAGLVATGQFSDVVVQVFGDIGLPSGQQATGDTTDVIEQDATVIPDPQTTTAQRGTLIVQGQQNQIALPSTQFTRGQFSSPFVLLSPTIVPTGQQAVGRIGSAGVSVNTGVTVVPEGLAAAAQFGTPIYLVNQTVVVSGFAMTGQFGVVVVSSFARGLVPGQTGTGAVGTPIFPLTDLPGGMSVDTEWGQISFNITDEFDPGFSDDTYEVPGGVRSRGQVGSPAVLFDKVFSVSGVSSSALVGAIAGATAQTVLPSGLASTGSFGSPAESTSATMVPTGLAGVGSGGAPVLEYGNKNLGIPGRATAGQVGVALPISSTTLVPDGVEGNGFLGFPIDVTDYTAFVQTLTTGVGIGTVGIQAGILITAVGQQAQCRVGIAVTPINTETITVVSGQQGVGQVGQPVVVADYLATPVGLQAVGSIGFQLLDYGNKILAVPGLATIGRVGTPVETESVEMAVIGVVTTGQFGNIGVENKIVILVTGLKSDTASGIAVTTPVTLVMVIGQEASAQINSVFVINQLFTSVLVGLLGRVVTSSIGTLVVTGGHLAPGQKATGFAGTVLVQTFSLDIALLEVEGQEMDGSVGAVHFDVGGDVGLAPTYTCVGDVFTGQYVCEVGIDVLITEEPDPGTITDVLLTGGRIKAPQLGLVRTDDVLIRRGTSRIRTPAFQ